MSEKDSTTGFLTEKEKELLVILGSLAGKFSEIAGYRDTRGPDMAEVFAGIHNLQRMVLSQAAARSYPKEFRLLGGHVDDEKTEVPR